MGSKMIRLKDELTLVHQQLKDAVLQNEQKIVSKDNYIKKLEDQLRERQKEISKLFNERRAYDPIKIRDSVFEEAKDQYEVKIKEIHDESDKMKKQYHSLHYEHAKLKCKLESHESEYSHSIERLRLQHLKEVEQLQNKIESLEKERSFPTDSAAIELKSAKHDILQLNVKLRALLAECEELRAKNESLTIEFSSSNRNHLKQIADNMSNIRALESEKQKAIMQKEVFEKELSNFQEQRRIMNNDLQASRREILSLKGKLEECEHKCHMIATDLQVENLQLKNKYQSEKEQLIDEISRVKLDLNNVSVELERTHEVLVSKEQELHQISSMARQQLWKQSNEFQQEKERIERKFKEFKDEKDHFISQLNHELQILQQNLQICAESKLELEKELISTKEKLQETSRGTDDTAIAMLSRQNSEYEREIHALKEQINHLKSNSSIFLEEKDRLLSDMLSKRKADYDHEEEKEKFQLKLNLEQQKHQFHQRLEDLESQLREKMNSSTAERKELELKIQKYSRVVNKLKEKLEIQKAKNEDLENKKEVLEKNVPYEVYLKMKNKLFGLQRRLEEFRLLVDAEPHLSTCSRAPGPVTDKLLTDIKNLQLRLPFEKDELEEYEAFKFAREKTADKSKKTSYHRKRSLRTRGRDQPSKTVSPVITSSSDLELENL